MTSSVQAQGQQDGQVGTGRVDGQVGTGRLTAAVLGVVAGGVTLGVGQLVAGALGRAVAPQLVVGAAAIDRTPEWLKEFAVRSFGEHDKDVLLGGVLTVVTLLSAALGVLARTHRRAAVAGVGVLGGVAALAAAGRPDARAVDVLPSIVGALVGAVVLARTLRARGGAGGVPRRAVLLGGFAAAIGAAVAEAGGSRLLAARQDVDASRQAVRLPAPADPAAPLPAGVQLDVPGLSPFRTPVPDFYRVDTALAVPRLTTDAWRLRVHGSVDRELELTFADLLRRPVVERDITLTCVSNEVGGRLLGTSRWLGTPLAPLLREAGVRPGASQLVSRSVEGMTIGTPVAAVLDGRDALLVYGMDGEPLRPEHGFPVRMLVPGLYGYTSATKWVVDLELTTFEAFDAYWVRRGWAQQATIATASRIDTPQPLARLRAGPVAVAGVAWAQHRGIAGVEVNIDGGPWQSARLAAPAGTDLWRQWILEWQATPGAHTLSVRATDGAGALQEKARRTPFPSGSTGWQSIIVTVV